MLLILLFITFRKVNIKFNKFNNYLQKISLSINLNNFFICCQNFHIE